MKQTWYVDDTTAIRKIADLHVWWDEITVLGPSYGYYANASKLPRTALLAIKKEFQSEANTTVESGC